MEKENEENSKMIEKIKEENSKMKIRIEQFDIVLEKKETEFEEMRKLVEEQREKLETTQDHLVDVKKKNQILNKKRKNGIKEIEKLRDRIEDMRTQYSVNHSLNTSFSMEAVRTDMSIILEPDKIQDLLDMYPTLLN